MRFVEVVMRPFLILLVLSIGLSRLAIDNQPTLGVPGLLSAAWRGDIAALTPAIIHFQHLGTGTLFGVSLGLFYAAGRLFEWEVKRLAWLAAMLAITVSLFELAVFFSRS